jgi:serine/threonine protein kinase
MKTIGNNYIIKRDLDKGATATVYLVECIKTAKIYAAKLYDKINDYNKTEIEILKKLSSSNNPYIIHLISWGEEYILIDGVAENNEKKLFIIIDYLPNKDLFSYIKSNEIDENMVKNFFYKILKAVEYCHSQGICHRDIKLENILLNEKNEPVLCDFGYGSLSIENLKFYIGS